MPTISDRIKTLKSRIENATERVGRAPGSVSVVAVSKRHPVSAIRAAREAGLRDFGENYVDEGLEKIPALKDLDITWHYIGPLQSNKTRSVAMHFDWVQSIDREKIARRLNNQRPAALPPLNACVQVNISGESRKSGVEPADAAELCQLFRDFPRLSLRGLMGIAENTDDEVTIRRQFEGLQTLFAELQQQGLDLDTLSMGMSSDLDIAIEAGSTMLRIGTDIFGPRTETD